MSSAERVGRYQLLEPIGVGPSGSVSRAKVFGVAGFERQFAVKRFHHELTAQLPTASALSAAARGYGSLEHPRIARMSEFGVAQGTTFTAVEYVAGLDALRLIAEARLAGNSLAAGGALALVSQAARAVGYAHGRGLTHLGLAPTNVIVTSEGDIKITDFGILAAALPQRPTDSQRLAHRIQYLAPEQLANEATSAATDVFALGVLAYELVTGQRTFRGDTPAQIAQSVMAGPPAEPPLPRPIVRVLQRCLARSPFERFPDARALADALDAALRVAPVPGTRKDIGAQVSATLERIAAMNEGELSGMLALDIGTGPIPRPPTQPVPALGRESEGNLDLSTLEFVRPDTEVLGPTPLVGPSSLANNPASTVPEMQKPFTTVPGLAPPPIPVPQGIATPPPGALPPPVPGTSTLLGIQNAKSPPAIPLGKLDFKNKPPTGKVPSIPGPPTPPPMPPPRPSQPRATSEPPPLPARPSVPRAGSELLPRIAAPPEGGAVTIIDDAARTGPRAERPSALMRAIDEADVVPPSSIGMPLPPDDGVPSPRSTDPGLGVFENSAAHRQPTSEMPPHVAEVYTDALTMPTHEMEPLVQQAWQAEARSADIPVQRMPSTPLPSTPQPQHSMTARTRPAPSRSRLPWIIAGAVGVAALGFGGWWAYNEYFAPEAPKVAVTPPPKDAGATKVVVDGAVATAPDAAGVAGDGAVVVVAEVDAGAAPADASASIDAQVALADAGATPAPDAGAVTPTASDSLTITSTPARARVFLDGADVGATPLKLPGTPDRHTIAVLLPGHELYVAQVDGQGAFAIPLKEVTPSGGPAGIKVTRCKDKDRYYVFVDGKPTGMTCPTERIEVELGPHSVEVYDVVSDSRKKFDVDVKDTRLSVRVKVE